MESHRPEAEERQPQQEREQDAANADVVAARNRFESVLYRREQQGPNDDTGEDEDGEPEVGFTVHSDELRYRGRNAQIEARFRLRNEKDEQHDSSTHDSRLERLNPLYDGGRQTGIVVKSGDFL
ncbi:hypothetical protein BG842_05730 [Haladaptatus sp. W1]|nr:hypothetical protein [Haladaptatus sp. W1]ODR80272.1 hypothetical protein BG842_05730 [Haladaptatus sp. W1]